jgi:hypothetical protein
MRQRIVINLDGPTTAGGKSAVAKKRRRWPRVLAVLVLLLVIGVVGAGVGGFFLWRHFQSTPTYTLALMLDAAQSNDVAEFQRRIDDEEIAKNIAARVNQKAAARYGYALNSSIQQRIDSTMPSLLPRVKQTVQDEFFNTMKAFAGAPEKRSFITIIGAVRSLLTITEEGDSAKATGSMAGRNIEMTMRRDGNGWKVIDVQDDVIVQRIVDNVMKELPAIGGIDPTSPLLKPPQRRRSGRGR